MVFSCFSLVKIVLFPHLHGYKRVSGNHKPNLYAFCLVPIFKIDGCNVDLFLLFFWHTVTHSVESARVEFTWKRQRLFDLTAAQIYHDLCVENPVAKVDSVSSKPKSKWRPLPMDTIVSSYFMLLPVGRIF